ncbi:MAG: hypothetical protein GX677_03625 [Treponema sp.]|nr:hypothetical protein [Treponema sp.]
MNNEPIPMMNKFSAAKSELGFEYQFYFFLWKLLKMKKGETVSWEVKEDVSLDLSDGTTYLFQIKHTIQKKIDETPINLTEMDSDLWKTLSNWSKIIIDRGDLSKQRDFINNTFFVLATNKSQLNNTILKNIDDYKDGKIQLPVLRASMLKLQNETKNKILSDYITNCLNLKDDIFLLFFNNLQFELEETDLIQRCKDAIEEKMIPSSKVDKVYDLLYSNIRNDNYITISNGNAVSISFEDFHKKYKRCFEIYRSGELVINKSVPNMPKSIENQLFIKQLVDIDDIASDDLDTQIEFTRFKLQLERNLDDWCQSGDITGIEKDDFLENGVVLWKNEFRSKYRKLSDPALFGKIGCQIIDELRKKVLNIKNQDIPSSLSNGVFYHLADIPKIGFSKNWESTYAK